MPNALGSLSKLLLWALYFLFLSLLPRCSTVPSIDVNTQFGYSRTQRAGILYYLYGKLSIFFGGFCTDTFAGPNLLSGVRAAAPSFSAARPLSKSKTGSLFGDFRGP